jgi:hypothetical protein
MLLLARSFAAALQQITNHWVALHKHCVCHACRSAALKAALLYGLQEKRACHSIAWLASWVDARVIWHPLQSIQLLTREAHRRIVQNAPYSVPGARKDK